MILFILNAILMFHVVAKQFIFFYLDCLYTTKWFHSLSKYYNFISVGRVGTWRLEMCPMSVVQKNLIQNHLRPRILYLRKPQNTRYSPYLWYSLFSFTRVQTPNQTTKPQNTYPLTRGQKHDVYTSVDKSP